MSIRAHRILKIQYAETTFFRAGSSLGEAIMNHHETTRPENGNQIEVTIIGLRQILTDYNSLSEVDQKDLTEEIEILVKEGYDEDEYITYDLF